MRIGIDAYPLMGQYAGIGVYVRNIIRHLERLDKENEYFLYASDIFDMPLESNPRWHSRLVKGLLNKSSTFWKQTQAKKQLTKDGIDLFWETNAILPLYLPPSIKTVLTVHDLMWLYHPDDMKWDNQLIFSLFFKRSLTRADRIIAISNTTKEGIFELIGNSNATVIYNGVDSSQFKPRDKNEAAPYLIQKFGISPDYILSVGTLEPRKNIEGLLTAFKKLLNDNPSLKYQLVIVGGSGWKNSKIFKTYKNLEFNEKQVKFLGYCSSEDLTCLY